MNDYNPFPILLNYNFKDKESGSRWIKRYIKFIKAIQNKRLTDSIDEKWNRHVHHIVPKSWGGIDDPNNLITMTIKEHIVAHHLLCKTMEPSMGFALVKLMGFANHEYVNPHEKFNHVISLRIATDANKSRFLRLLHPVCNLNTGKIYDSVLEASKAECGNEWSVPTAIMNQSKANDCYWMRVEDMTHDREWHLQQIIKHQEDKKLKDRFINARPVINLTTREVYLSASIAGETIGYSTDTVTGAIRDRHLLDGCMWDFVDNVGNDIDGEIEKRNQIKQYNAKYAGCSSIVDLYDGKVFKTIDDVSAHFGIATASVVRYLRAFTPYQEQHYFVRQQLVEDEGRENLLKKVQKWNEKFLENRKKYLKSKRVINLTTKETFDSIKLAKKKYPNDNIQYHVKSHNPSPHSNCYWMYEIDVTKSLDEHLAEFEQRFNEVGKKKRRQASRYNVVPVVDVTDNKEYSSLLEYANQHDILIANICTKFKRKEYYIRGVLLVPKDVLMSIPDLEAFKIEQFEKERLARHNEAVINLTTMTRYATVALAAKYSGLSNGVIKTAIRTGDLKNDEKWVRENAIPHEQYVNLKLTHVDE